MGMGITDAYRGYKELAKALQPASELRGSFFVKAVVKNAQGTRIKDTTIKVESPKDLESFCNAETMSILRYGGSVELRGPGA